MSEMTRWPEFTTSHLPPLLTFSSSSQIPHLPVVTHPPTADPPDFSRHFEGSSSTNIAVIIFTLILGIIAVCLNVGVVHFYRPKRSLIACIYMLLGASGLSAGGCSVLNAIAFGILHTGQGHVTSARLFLLVVTCSLTLVTSKVSELVSAVLAFTRVVTVVRPSWGFRRFVLALAVGVYTVCWAGLALGDVVVVVDGYMRHATTHHRESSDRVMSFFFYPGRCKWGEYIAHKFGLHSSNLECFLDAVYNIPLYLACVGITLTCTVVLLMYPKKEFQRLHTAYSSQDHRAPVDDTLGDTSPRDRKENDVSLTIIMLNVVYLICYSLTLYQSLHSCVAPSALKDRRVSYLMGNMPIFVNTALNPIILLWREEELRVALQKKLRGTKGSGGIMREETTAF